MALMIRVWLCDPVSRASFVCHSAQAWRRRHRRTHSDNGTIRTVGWGRVPDIVVSLSLACPPLSSLLSLTSRALSSFVCCCVLCCVVGSVSLSLSLPVEATTRRHREKPQTNSHQSDPTRRTPHRHQTNTPSKAHTNGSHSRETRQRNEVSAVRCGVVGGEWVM